MDRLNTVNHETKLEVIEYSLPKTLDSPYVVDDSNFIPIKEAIKQLNRIADPSASELEQSYDFPNGIDNGKQIPITRTHNFGDIAELAVEVNQQTDKMREAIMAGQKELAYKQEVAEKMKAVKSASIDNGSSSE